MAKAEKDAGWRVWDRIQRRYWGPTLARQPEALLVELNGPKRGPELDRLVKEAGVARKP